ncbi:MAG: ribosome hibernation-promoting factor, HPF/YfiA family, partial [Planctomycetota bacterium]
MQVNISSKHMQMTPAIEEYASKKIEKFPRYFNRVQQVEVIIDKAKNGYTVDIITNVEHHEAFVATSSHGDLYA